MAKIKETKINKVKQTYKKTKKATITLYVFFLAMVILARQINAHYINHIEPWLLGKAPIDTYYYIPQLPKPLLDASKVLQGRELVKKGNYIIIVISYLPTIFATLKYDDREQKAQAQLNTFHNVFEKTNKKTLFKKTPLYKVKKIREDKLQSAMLKELKKEFGKIRKQRLKDKTPFSPQEFKGIIKVISQTNPVIAKYLYAVSTPDYDPLDIYYRYKDELDKYIV